MRMFAMFTLVTFVPLISCMNTTEGFRSVKEQEQVVVPLLSEVKSLSHQITRTSKIMIRYEDALQKTRDMISKAKELAAASSTGTQEIGDDVDSADMLFSAAMNSLEEFVALNRVLQQHVNAKVKMKLERELTELRESLK